MRARHLGKIHSCACVILRIAVARLYRHVGLRYLGVDSPPKGRRGVVSASLVRCLFVLNTEVNTAQQHTPSCPQKRRYHCGSLLQGRYGIAVGGAMAVHLPVMYTAGCSGCVRITERRRHHANYSRIIALGVRDERFSSHGGGDGWPIE